MFPITTEVLHTIQICTLSHSSVQFLYFFNFTHSSLLYIIELCCRIKMFEIVKFVWKAFSYSPSILVDSVWDGWENVGRLKLEWSFRGNVPLGGLPGRPLPRRFRAHLFPRSSQLGLLRWWPSWGRHELTRTECTKTEEGLSPTFKIKLFIVN